MRTGAAPRKGKGSFLDLSPPHGTSEIEMANPNRPVTTNVLIPESHREALKDLAKKTRVRQSEYLREAVADLLNKYADAIEEGSSEAA